MKTGKTQQALLAAALILVLAFAACSDGDDGDKDNNSGNNGNGGNNGSQTDGSNGDDGSDNGGYSHITSIAYGNGMFIAVGGPLGDEKVITCSTDGVTWTKAANHLFGSGIIQSIAYGDGTFVAVGEGDSGNTVIAYSSDGITWTAANTSFGTRYLGPVVWGADKFVVAGRYSGSSGMVYSADGLTWTAVPNTINALGSNGIIEAIGWGGGKFVAGTTYMAYSADGITWTKAANNPFGTTKDEYNNYYGGGIWDFAWGNGTFVAAGVYGMTGLWSNYEGTIAYSTDANNWTTVEDSTFGSTTVSAVTFGNGMFVAGGTSGGKMAYSTDGVTWTAVEDSTFGTAGFYDIVWGNDKFVAVGNLSRMAYSYDGITWTAVKDSTFP